MGDTFKKRLPLIGLLVLAVTGFAFHEALSLEALARHRVTLLAWRDGAPWALGLGFVVTYVAVVAASIPGATVLSLTGGFLFGLFPGLILNMAGASLGALALFLAARLGLAADVARSLSARGGAAKRLYDRLHQHEIAALFAMRFLPAVPFFLANLLAAAAGVRLWTFALTTVIGIAPGSVILTQIGAGLGAVFDAGQTPDLSILASPAIWGPLLGLAVLSALPVIFGRAR